MANRTVKDAHTVKGTNPQFLIEKIIRSRIYESKYWKENCFALTAELLVDRAMELKYIGGHYGGNVKPTPFLCLVLKMLQIQPEKDIVIEFIKSDHKYVRSLGAFYIRMTGTSLDCYKYLEPLLNDSSKIRVQNKMGGFELTYMDEFIDSLLREERVCDCILPRLQKRMILEENGELDIRVSALEDDMDIDDIESDLDEEGQEEGEVRDRGERRRSRSPARRRSRSPGRRRSRSRSRDRRDRHRRSRSRERRRERSPKRSRKHRSRSRDRSRDKDRYTRDQLDINEANELRAKLGLAPLKP